MDYHYHAGLTVRGREYLAKNVVEGRLSLREAAAECRLSRQAAGKWVRRYREEGLVDRHKGNYGDSDSSGQNDGTESE